MGLDYFGWLKGIIPAMLDAFIEDNRNLIHLAFPLIILREKRAFRP